MFFIDLNCFKVNLLRNTFTIHSIFIAYQIRTIYIYCFSNCANRH